MTEMCISLMCMSVIQQPVKIKEEKNKKKLKRREEKEENYKKEKIQ